MRLPKGARHFLRSIVEISEGTFGIKFQNGIRIDAREGCQLLDLGLRLLALRDIGETAGGAKNTAVVVQCQLSIHFHPTDLSVLGEQAGFIAAIIQLALNQLEKNMTVPIAVIVVNEFEEQGAQDLFCLKA